MLKCFLNKLQYYYKLYYINIEGRPCAIWDRNTIFQNALTFLANVFLALLCKILHLRWSCFGIALHLCLNDDVSCLVFAAIMLPSLTHNGFN